MRYRSYPYQHPSALRRVINLAPPSDPTAIALIISLIVHGIGIGLIHFEPLVFRPNPSKSLEVILVEPRSNTDPPVNDPDYLAQINQEGGNLEDVHQINPPAIPPAMLPLVSSASNLQDNKLFPFPITTSSSEMQTLPKERLINREPTIITPSTPQLSWVHLSTVELMNTFTNFANLDHRLNFSNEVQRLRNKYISAHTQEYKYAAYMDAWRMKVERVANLNYPLDAQQQAIYGSLILDVALNPHGDIEEISVIRSSGNKLLDASAIQIVKLAAPFAPFPRSIRNDTDILHITRTWQFIEGNLSSAP